MSSLPGPALPSHGYCQQAAPAPHMLLELSTGAPSPGVQTPAVAPRPPPQPASASLGPIPPAPPGTVVPGAAARKRFRTKFSPEQKQRMQALSERLSWRLQKRDECCQEMGVFKVWMHNNKHKFIDGHSACRSASASAAAATAIHHHPSNHGPGRELGLLRVRMRRCRLRLLPLTRGAATNGDGGEQAGRRCWRRACESELELAA
ncbi:hypothetical protein BDA96_02G240400 [Sorghum bicolor]|uniref:ZF-HD dimerization-type domain-containing protein n=1 Tax=Sorghum bicolor TaxID=4558 RepID=A0A921UTW3_SORBI|nr:hypothetical protein BDA96_02G240400 [Sorghum bicolor]